jgi:soluble lytic murein transglycosylase-like protein
MQEFDTDRDSTPSLPVSNLHTMRTTSQVYRGRPGIRALAAAALVATSSLVLAPPTEAGGPIIRPSREQMVRLYHLEPYIEYFSSLPYGRSKTRVSPAFIRALILTESSAKKWALSIDGARGLTQIMPNTGRHAVKQLAEADLDYRFIPRRAIDDFDSDDLYNPALNILIACHLNAQYHNAYNGRSDLSAAAWNAGPGAVDRYGKKVPNYAETKGMVKRLMGYMSYFESLDATASAD